MNNPGYQIGSGGTGVGIDGEQTLVVETELWWLRVSPWPVNPLDLDGDRIVGAADLAVLLGAWGDDLSMSDLDASGSVGASDLGLLLGGWTQF